MRIIEPKNQRHRKKTVNKQKRSMTRPVVIVALMLVASGLFLSLANNYRNTALNSSEVNATLSTSITSDASQVAGVSDIGFKYFTGEQFQQLAEGLFYPNTLSLDYLPEITGNNASDERIRTIAESRGYQLRHVPVLPIVKTNEPDLGDDDLLQPKAYHAWQLLKSRAKNAKVPLTLASGYRSIERQRELFTSRLASAGVNVDSIANGSQDTAISNLLSTTAPPGYSRHHTGYALDLACDDNTGRKFKETSCFTWLKEDNYKNAKQNGFTPSYPDGADQQGPEPEPWEYVWVGVTSLLE
jgi:D-alanyl-D-alanine carboxypeptidase